MKNRVRHLALLAFSLGVATAVVACDFNEGPNLSIEVLDTDLRVVPPAQPMQVPSTGDPTLCCCQVGGIALNTSAVPVHATLKFYAYEAGNSEEIGTAILFLEDLPPGRFRSFGLGTSDEPGAVGFVRPCDTIDRIELVDKDLRAVVTVAPR